MEPVGPNKFFKGLLIGIPISVALWGLLAAAVCLAL